MNSQFQSLFQQAMKAFHQGDFASAVLMLNRILQVDSNNFPSLHLLGLIKASQFEFIQAITYLSKAARIQPNDAAVHYNLAKAFEDSGDEGKAMFYYSKALTLNKDFAEAWSNKGALLNKLKLYDEAITHFDKALGLRSDIAETWFNKGNSLDGLKRYDEAITHYDKALGIQDGFAEAFFNKGAALYELKRFDEAIVHYDHVLSLKHDSPEAWYNKGAALYELKRFNEAIAQYDEALSLKPDYAKAWSSKGAALYQLKHYDGAILHFDKALSLQSDIDWVFGDLVHTKMKICSWFDYANSLDLLSKKIIANEMVVIPFGLLALSDDPLLNRKASEIYAQSKFLQNDILGPIPKYSKNQKIRIGYFSVDFRNHAVSALMVELFELHDKDKFEIIAFSFGADDKSPMRLRLSQAFNQFIDVRSLSDLDIAKLSREFCIDIAVDLGGYTSAARTSIFAYRAAPIQVNYLGYPGTMGGNYIDYIIADETLIPDNFQPYYSEKVAYLPNSYQVNDRKRLISERQFTRKELGLPESGFVFCCFNNNFKILPGTFASWMKILKAVEGSVLWIFQENSWVVDNLKKEALSHGVEVTRLIFAERMEQSEHLARHQQADLFLDTFPYNAHTTASDALWAGLPVLTLMGRSFASRVAASLLNAVGLAELITNTQEEYESLAIELALNPNKLSKIKSQLAENRLTSPLFDTPLFTKNIEEIYSKMYERYHANSEPDHISIF